MCSNLNQRILHVIIFDRCRSGGRRDRFRRRVHAADVVVVSQSACVWNEPVEEPTVRMIGIYYRT